MKRRLRNLIVDGPNSLGARARARRAEQLLALVPDLQDLRVLDLGGTRNFWERFPVRPAHLTTVNTAVDPEEESVPWHEAVVGDACDLPSDVTAQSFDFVFSNSTIEHVGDRERRRLFAETVRAMADRHWIQTPNRSFPIEPHVLFPFEQFFPVKGRAAVHRYWPLCHSRARTWEAALEAAGDTELLARSELEEIFPDSRIEKESVLPVLPAKSFVVVR